MPELDGPVLFENLKTQGWDNVPFNVPEETRAAYATAANAVITEAVDHKPTREALELDITKGFETGTVRTGNFGIGYARNSLDRKVYLHTGFDSRAYADTVVPERNQSQELRDLWELNEELLGEIELASSRVLEALGASDLKEVLFPAKALQRNIHLRTVRYGDALDAEQGSEVVSGHSDIGMMTFHLYETHGNWFHAAPYTPELVMQDDSPDRRQAVREMRQSLELIEPEEEKATFFLGANWFKFPRVPEQLRGLPACYHAGIRPLEDVGTVSEFAQKVTGNDTDRVSVISFLHPGLEHLLNGTYIPASVNNCRPAYEENVQ